MPSILFIHENYPAQFGALAEYLGSRGWKVVFATAREDFKPGKVRRIGNVDVVRYTRAREAEGRHPYLKGTEHAVLNGQAFARTGAGLAKGGFTPDIIVAHSGWGSGSFARIVWPEAKLVQYLEWWYTHPAPDVVPGTQSGPPEDIFARTLVRNLPFLLDYQQADLVIAPTQYQADQAPDFIRQKLIVQHDGVDCTQFRPKQESDAPFSLGGVSDDAPIVTFATRGMEPMRGFPAFMAAAAQIQARNPEAHIVVAGRDSIHYGPKLAGSKTFKDIALARNRFDHDRLHFVGMLPKKDYARLLQRSNAHVYLTQPFVLSWSLIEAMATGCPLIVSNTAPVQEALPDSNMAKYVPMDDEDAIASAALSLLARPQQAIEYGQRARDHACAHYDTRHCYPALEHILLTCCEGQNAAHVA